MRGFAYWNPDYLRAAKPAQGLSGGRAVGVDGMPLLGRIDRPAPLQCSCVSCGTSASSPKALAYCADLNVDGQVSALDALAALKLAVGQP